MYQKSEYGQAPGEIDAELINKVLGDEKPLTIRFADTLEPEFEKVKEQLKDVAKNDRDVLSYIAFPQVAEKFFKDREKKTNAGELKKVTYSITKIEE